MRGARGPNRLPRPHVGDDRNGRADCADWILQRNHATTALGLAEIRPTTRAAARIARSTAGGHHDFQNGRRGERRHLRPDANPPTLSTRNARSLEAHPPAPPSVFKVTAAWRTATAALPLLHHARRTPSTLMTGIYSGRLARSRGSASRSRWRDVGMASSRRNRRGDNFGVRARSTRSMPRPAVILAIRTVPKRAGRGDWLRRSRHPPRVSDVTSLTVAARACCSTSRRQPAPISVAASSGRNSTRTHPRSDALSGGSSSSCPDQERLPLLDLRPPYSSTLCVDRFSRRRKDGFLYCITARLCHFAGRPGAPVLCLGPAWMARRVRLCCTASPSRLHTFSTGRRRARFNILALHLAARTRSSRLAGVRLGRAAYDAYSHLLFVSAVMVPDGGRARPHAQGAAWRGGPASRRRFGRMTEGAVQAGDGHRRRQRLL